MQIRASWTRWRVCCILIHVFSAPSRRLVLLPAGRVKEDEDRRESGETEQLPDAVGWPAPSALWPAHGMDLPGSGLR